MDFKHAYPDVYEQIVRQLFEIQEENLFHVKVFSIYFVGNILLQIVNPHKLLYHFQENAGLVVPWLIGILTFISFEALGLVYANVLKDQIFGVSFKFSKRRSFECSHKSLKYLEKFADNARGKHNKTIPCSKKTFVIFTTNVFFLNSSPSASPNSTLMFSAKPS